MAFSFSTLSNDLTDIRAAANTINGIYASLKTARSDLIDQLETDAITELIGPGEQILSKLISAGETAQTELIELSRRRIMHRVKTLEELPWIHDENDLAQCLRAIFDIMITLANTTPLNTVTLGSITKTVTNSTAGNLYTTKKLPGNIAPGPGMIAHTGLYDLDSELPDSDSVYATYDSASRLFIVSGKPAPAVPYGSDSVFGNKGTVGVDSTGSGNKISNFFENFTLVANVPDGWTIVGGAAGTEIKEDTTTVLFGSKALRLEGTSEIKFPIASQVEPRQMLLLSLWLRKAAGTTSGTYKLQMKGTGMTTQETAAFNATDLSSSAWTEKTLHLKVPAAIPSDLAIHIVTTTVDTTDGIFLDGGILQPYTYWAGVGFAMTVGGGSYVPGDQFNFTITNDYAGVVQTWIARAHGFQLPSA